MQVRNHGESFSKLVDICQRLCLLIKRHRSQLMNAITASRCHEDVPTGLASSQHACASNGQLLRQTMIR